MANKVLAKVNGIEITDAMLDATIERIPEDRRAYFGNEFGRKQLLDQLINVELINAYGSEIGIDKDDKYRMAMEQAEKDIRFNATMEKIMQDISVDDESIRKVYDANPAQFNGPETIGAKHILVDSEDKAKEIKSKLDNKEMTFEEAASEYSSCPSKENGGDLGQFGKGMMVPEFENAAFGAELNTTTEPVKTQFGYHLINVYEKNEAKTPDFEEVKEQIKNQLLQEKQMKKYNETIDSLKAKYLNK